MTSTLRVPDSMDEAIMDLLSRHTHLVTGIMCSYSSPYVGVHNIIFTITSTSKDRQAGVQSVKIGS